MSVYLNNLSNNKSRDQYQVPGAFKVCGVNKGSRLQIYGPPTGVYEPTVGGHIYATIRTFAGKPAFGLKLARFCGGRAEYLNCLPSMVRDWQIQKRWRRKKVREATV